jgi:hypothetical protein
MAKKRHHESVKERLAESRGMEHHLYRKAASMGLKHGMDPRRRQEMEDAGMIHEDHRAVANLPQGVIQREWPSSRSYHDFGLDDTIRGINKQENEDNARMEKHLQPGKY